MISEVSLRNSMCSKHGSVKDGMNCCRNAMDLTMIGSLLRSAAASRLLESPSTKIVDLSELRQLKRKHLTTGKVINLLIIMDFFLGGKGYLNFRNVSWRFYMKKIIFENLPI